MFMNFIPFACGGAREENLSEEEDEEDSDKGSDDESKKDGETAGGLTRKATDGEA